jgi:hypothetical protein
MNNFLPIAVPNVAVNQFIALPSIGKSLSRPNHLPLAGRSKFKQKHNPVNDMNNFLPIAVPNVAVNQFIALPSTLE